MKIALICCLLATSTVCFAQLDSLEYYYKAGLTAAKEDNVKGYFENINRANAIRPNHPTLLHHLALAALNNNLKQEAIKAVRASILNNADYNLADSAFTTLRNEPDFIAISSLAQELKVPIDNTKPHMQLPLKAHAESIAIDEQRNRLYIGTVNSRAIMVKDEFGVIKTVIDHTQDSAIFSVLGMALNTTENLLWVCTTAMPQMQGFHNGLEGHSSLLAIDLNLGMIVRKVEAKNGHAFGDIKLNHKGAPVISDGRTNNIYLLQEDELKPLIDGHHDLLNVQGFDFNENQSHLYFADYIKGLYRVSMTTGQVEKITFPTDIPEKGIDGLYFDNQHLYVTQNGTNPKRVLKLKLSAEGREVNSYTVLMQSLPELNEPTQGYLGAKEFYFIVNSAWDKYDENEQLKLEELNLLYINKVKR